MKFHRLIILLVILPFLLFANKKTIMPQDVVNITLVSNPQISPDGKWIAFEVQEALAAEAPKSRRSSDIWIVATDGNAPARKLIAGPKDEYSPLWSTNGKHLAWLSNSGEGGINQIYYLQDLSGEPVKLTNAPAGVTGFKWFKNADEIAFTSMAPLKPAPDKKPLSDAYEAGKQSYISRLYKMSLKDTLAVQISTNEDSANEDSADEDNVNSFDISPDGSKVVMCASSSASWDEISYHSKLVVYDMGSKQRKELAKIEGDLIMSIGLGNVRWSPEGKNILYFERFGQVYTMLPAIISADGSSKKILAKEYKGTIWEMDWLNSGQSILVSSQEGLQGIIGRVDLRTVKMHKITNVGLMWSYPNNWSISADGKYIAYKDADYNSPENIWIMNSDGTNKKQLTNFNPQVKNLAFGQEEIIRWKSKDGSAMEGLLIKPAAYEANKKYPLVTVIHGGPEWAWWKGWQLSWHDWGQMLASNGYAVLLPNPRGSNGYGWEFVEGNINNWDEGDYNDVMTGIDYLIERGLADEEKLGICGWSYGGYLTAWSITKTARFKAAIAGAGFYNIMSFYGLCYAKSFFQSYLGGTAYEKQELYRRLSPLSRVQKVKTPTLLLHGKNDFGVSITQAQEFYEGLRAIGTDCKLVIYPREGHAFKERGHQMDSLQRILDWFEKYLK